MLQEINPNVFNNQYAVKKAMPSDYAIIVEDGKIACRIKENGELKLPKIFDLKSGDTLRYLCSVDDKNFFMAQVAPIGFDMQPIKTLRYVSPGWLRYGALEAASFAGWYEKNKFCGRCGSEMRHSDVERALQCPDCKNLVFPKINPCVIVAVTKGDQLLLTKYKDPRRFAEYALVAGFAEIGETIEECVAREVMEETGLHVKNLRFYKSQPWPFSDSLLFGFYCDVDDADIDKAPQPDDDEIAIAEWIDRDDVPVRAEDVSLTSEMMKRFHDGEKC